jgi:hypothetical protein
VTASRHLRINANGITLAVHPEDYLFAAGTELCKFDTSRLQQDEAPRRLSLHEQKLISCEGPSLCAHCYLHARFTTQSREKSRSTH